MGKHNSFNLKRGKIPHTEMKEKWYDCKDKNDKIDWSPYYEVNKLGQIRRKSRIQQRSNGRTYMLPTKILKTRECTPGLHVSVTFTVTIDGIQYKKTAYPHRYLALAAIPNPKNYPFVSHRKLRLNGKSIDFRDNRLKNLFWSNQSMISKRAMKIHPENKTNLKNINEKSGYYKELRKTALNRNQIDEIVRLKKEGYNAKELRLIYNVSLSTIYKALKNG